MLVLSRKTNESVTFDGDIEIKVISVHGGRVKLGITAPDSVGIVRTELLEMGFASNSVDEHDAFVCPARSEIEPHSA
jgi:carbon storage regulator